MSMGVRLDSFTGFVFLDSLIIDSYLVGHEFTEKIHTTVSICSVHTTRMSDKKDSDSDFKNNIFTSYREAETSLKRKSKNEREPPVKKIKLFTANSQYQQTSPALNNTTPGKKSLGKALIAKNDTFPSMKSQHEKQDIDSDVETVKLNPEINYLDLDSREHEIEDMDSARETSDEEVIKSYNNDSNKYLQEPKCSNENNDSANNSKQRKHILKYPLGENVFEDGVSGEQKRIPTDTLRDSSESEVKNIKTSAMSHMKQSARHDISPSKQKKTVHQKVIKSAVSKKHTSVSRPTISSSDSEISINKSTAFSENPESFGKLASEFILKNPGYKEMSFPEKLSLSQLDDDDIEVFYLQMPHSFNAKWLKGSSISLSGKTKIKAKDKTFAINPVSDDSPKPLFIFSDCLQKVEPSKSFIMQQTEGVRKKRQPSVSDKNNVPMCSRVKLRHPVFGAYSTDKIELESSVHKRLERAVSNVKKHKGKLLKKSVKKTSVKNEMHIDDEKQEIIFEMLQAHNFDGAKSHKSSSFSKKQKRNEPHSKKNSDSTCEDTDSGIVDTKSEPLVPENNGQRYSFVNSTLNANLLHHPCFDSEISRINIDNSSKNIKVKGIQKTKAQESDLITDILSSVKSKLAVDIHEKKPTRKKKSNSSIV